MRIIESMRRRDPRAADEVAVAVTKDELRLLMSAMNEATEALEDWEFEVRIGGSRAGFRQLLSDLRVIWDASE